MKCSECGAEIGEVLVDKFSYDGDDSYERVELQEVGDKTYEITVDHSWTGDELDDDEARETVLCPHCRKFPFKTKALNRQEIVHLIFWN